MEGPTFQSLKEKMVFFETASKTQVKYGRYHSIGTVEKKTFQRQLSLPNGSPRGRGICTRVSSSESRRSSLTEKRDTVNPVMFPYRTQVCSIIPTHKSSAHSTPRSSPTPHITLDSPTNSPCLCQTCDNCKAELVRQDPFNPMKSFRKYGKFSPISELKAQFDTSSVSDQASTSSRDKDSGVSSDELSDDEHSAEKVQHAAEKVHTMSVEKVTEYLESQQPPRYCPCPEIQSESCIQRHMVSNQSQPNIEHHMIFKHQSERLEQAQQRVSGYESEYAGPDGEMSCSQSEASIPHHMTSENQSESPDPDDGDSVMSWPAPPSEIEEVELSLTPVLAASPVPVELSLTPVLAASPVPVELVLTSEVKVESVDIVLSQQRSLEVENAEFEELEAACALATTLATTAEMEDLVISEEILRPVQNFMCPEELSAELVCDQAKAVCEVDDDCVRHSSPVIDEDCVRHSTPVGRKVVMSRWCSLMEDEEDEVSMSDVSEVSASDQAPFHSPFEGTISLNMSVKEATSNESPTLKGFLTIFQEESGLGAWNRRWCSVQDNKIYYWLYPEDEVNRNKEPHGDIDLRDCKTSKISVASRLDCARPNTFVLITETDSKPGDRNSIICEAGNERTVTKYLLSADSKEERREWMKVLNTSLENVISWNTK